MATRYQELIAEGPRGWALGFVQGYLRGRDADNRVIDAEEEGFECESFREQIKELLQPASEVLHLVAPEPLVPLVREAVNRGAELGRAIRILHSRPLAGARFRFSFSIYSRQHAARIRGLFENLPEGVKLTEDTRMDERSEPGPKTLDMYAPVHSFELQAKGGVRGPFEGILTLYRVCRHEELIHAERAELLGE